MPETQGLYVQDRDDRGLTRRERQVAELLTGEEKITQLEAADRLGVSRQRIRQIVESLMAKGVEIPGAKAPEKGKFAQEG